jgi:hypothetical protein
MAHPFASCENPKLIESIPSECRASSVFQKRASGNHDLEPSLPGRTEKVCGLIPGN